MSETAVGTESEQGALAARGSAFSLIGTACGAVANFAMLALVGNKFGSEAFGVFSGATASFLLAAVVLRLGGDTGATWFVAQVVEEGRTRSVRRALRVALVPVMVVSVVAAAAAAVLAPELASVLTDRAGQDDYATLLRIFAVAIPIATVGEVLLGATRGLGSMRPTVLASQFGRQVGQLVTVVAAIAMGGDLTDVGVAWALPYLVALVYPALWLRSRLPRRGQLELIGGERYWRYTGPQAANAAAQSGLEKFDIIAIGFLAGSVAQGEYSVANRMAHVVVLGWYAINLAQAPVYARLFAAGREQELRRVVQTVSGWAVVLVAPILWIYIVFPGVVARLFGSEFEGAGDALVILAAALLAALLLGPSENLLLMSGRSSRAFINNLLALAANIALNLLLVPEFGIRGAAAAWTVTLLFARGIAAAQVAGHRKVHAIGRPLLEAWVSAAICFGGVGALVRVGLGATVGALVIAIVAGATVFVAVIYMRRAALRFDVLVASLVGGDRIAGPIDHAERSRIAAAPHLRFGLRSGVSVAMDSAPAVRATAVEAVQAGGWRGQMARATVGRGYASLPGGLASRLPLVSRTDGAGLTVPASVAGAAVDDALERLSGVESIEGVVWLVPPPSDRARAAALIVAGGSPVAHVRISADLASTRPDPVVDRGRRTGVEWPMILDRWTREEVEIELSTVIELGPHNPTELDSDVVLRLVDDLQDALDSGSGPRWTTPMHGDLTPWNLRSGSGRIVLFDWEHRCYGPRDADLVRYVTTASGGLELFESLSARRRRGAADAIEWYVELAVERADQAERSTAMTRWKRRDQAEEMERLAQLARMAR